MQVLQDYNVDLIFLAGYIRILTPKFVNMWKDRIINLHPSLLPSFPGLHAVRDALNKGVKITGCTIHYVDVRLYCHQYFTKHYSFLIKHYLFIMFNYHYTSAGWARCARY